MKASIAALLLAGTMSATANQLGARSLAMASVHSLEQAIPAPVSLPAIQAPAPPKNQTVEVEHKDVGLVETNTEADEGRMKFKKNKKTTLTIVQDFPKKQNDGAANINLVQGKEKLSDVKIETDPSKKTTLTIV